MKGPGDAESASGPSTISPAKRTFRALAIAFFASIFCFCSSCVVFGMFASRRAERLADFDAPPAMAEDEADPVYRLVDAARRDAPTHSCEELTLEIRDELARLRDDEIVAFHGHLGELLETLDTQGMRSACQAVSAGYCELPRYAAVRASVLLLGRAATEAARRDADSLARVLPSGPGCPDLLTVAHAALYAKRQAARITATEADGGVERAAAAETPIPALPRFDDATPTMLRDRTDLSAEVPRLCRRFTCGPRDLF